MIKLLRLLINSRHASDVEWHCKTCNANLRSGDGVSPVTCPACGGAQFNAEPVRRAD